MDDLIFINNFFFNLKVHLRQFVTPQIPTLVTPIIYRIITMSLTERRQVHNSTEKQWKPHICKIHFIKQRFKNIISLFIGMFDKMEQYLHETLNSGCNTSNSTNQHSQIFSLLGLCSPREECDNASASRHRQQKVHKEE